MEAEQPSTNIANFSADNLTGNLRIIHVFREPVGGLFRHVRDLVKAQSAKGHQVGILCDATTGDSDSEALLDALRPHLDLGLKRIAMQRQIGPGDIAAAIRAYKTIKKLRPDVLHGHGAKGGAYARIFGSVLRVFKSRVARIYSPHGGSLHFEPTSIQGRLAFTAERLLSPLTDAMLFVCAYERHVLESRIGRVRSLHSIVANGLDAQEFLPVPSNIDAADLLFIGTMRDLKGPDLLIRAIAIAQMRMERPISAVFVGNGSKKLNYIALAAELGLTDCITFVDGMPAREAFVLGKTVIVPSRAEALPYIVLESLAARKPVIASRVGGIPEIFGPQSLALTDPTAEALAEKIIFALQQPEIFRSHMPDEQTLRARFSAQAMASAIDAVYLAARALAQ